MKIITQLTEYAKAATYPTQVAGIVGDVLKLSNNDTTGFLKQYFIAPRWIKLLQSDGDTVVLANHQRVKKLRILHGSRISCQQSK